MKSSMKITDKIKTSVCVGFAAALLISSASSAPQAANHSFLFPQFTSSAAADKSAKTSGTDRAEITYTFKIAELIEKLFL